ncbi:MAG: zinc ribbon-containing protein [gamma proteobacterium symbiont of Bathyaustriella thionipta]|nr:zinc ribbon-containing protein [gamma proteobacterium symbiont of Bathyaustriella thionipta]
MSKTEDLNEKLVQGYESMLASIVSLTRETEETALPALKELTAKAHEKAVELGELSREEADKVSRFLQRDILDAAHFLEESSQDFKTWLKFDIKQAETRLLDAFLSVADRTRTRTELAGFNRNTSPQEEYHTGEICGAGTLTCVQCGKELHFKKPGHIPPCPACKGTLFKRA